MTKEISNENKLEAFDLAHFKSGKNFYIEASAGTGKTFTICEIVAKLVAEGFPLSKILLVTYTEKATGELRDRIRGKMESSLESATENKALFKAALLEVDNAPIFTIHSFCERTLADFAYEAGVPFDLAMAPGSDLSDFIDRIIRDEWPADEEFQKIITLCKSPSLNLSSELDDLKQILASSIEQYCNDEKILKLEELPSSLEDDSLTFSYGVILLNINSFNDLFRIPKFEEYLKELEQLNNLLKTGSIVATKNKKERCILLYDSIKQWNRGMALFDGKVIQQRWLPDEASSIFEFFKNLKEQLDDGISEILNFHKEHFLYLQTKKIAAEWIAFKQENKLQSFNDMLTNVRNAVKNETFYTKLRERYKYAIIDEFQDTNQTQWDIFSKVFLDSPTNNIIVVGDPKQSIYSFQGADVNVYESAIRQIRTGYRLGTNYRSTNEIINACNRLFNEEIFKKKLFNFTDSAVPDEKASKQSALYNGKPLKSILIPSDGGKSTDAKEFAWTAVWQIVDFISPTVKNAGETALQIFDKESKNRRNVKFSDFAVLARTRTEMEEIERAMKRVGIPFVRYKDSNLFSGRECVEWITLLNALNAFDFTARNRGYLNALLVTDFFRIELNDVESDNFEDPQNQILSKIIDWKSLAERRRWSELQERIYGDTEIDKYLNTPSSLQNLTKIRQIGTYIFDYLYNHRVSLEEIIKHLNGLHLSSEDADDQDGNLVQKGSDLDAVQVMTIHASKGLEFPVVIAVAGFKGINNNTKGPYQFHQDATQKTLGFSAQSKKNRQAEEKEEWVRLFYVAYTRASSVMILPYYKNWEPSKKTESPFNFLKESVGNIINSEYGKSLNVLQLTVKANPEIDNSQLKENPDIGKIKNKVQKILNRGKTPDDTPFPEIQSLQKKLAGLSLIQHSYSSLATRQMNHEDVSLDGAPLNKEGSIDISGKMPSHLHTPIDGIGHQIPVKYEASSEDTLLPTAADYPRGKRLGNAIHEVFENADFVKFGMLSVESEAIEDSSMSELVEKRFLLQSLPIKTHPAWKAQTAKFVWNTLNAELPEIQGTQATGKSFRLNSLSAGNCRAEMEFQLNADENAVLHTFCKGFIDLMFVRDGRYSILDWKSDKLADDDYFSAESLKAKVDTEYSVQRVLYSYCLVKWLKSFYGVSESEVFEKYFGGIYYAFIRGTKSGTGNGIYAQTWASFADLEKSYQNVRNLMTGRI